MHAARENLGVTDATMRFMVPESDETRAERDATLRASVHDPEQRARVDSGRLCTPTVYPWAAGRLVGAVLPDAPVQPVRGTAATRLRELVATHPVRLHVGVRAREGSDVEVIGLADGVPPGDHPVVRDVAGLVAARLGAAPTVVEVRPDGYVEAVRAVVP